MPSALISPQISPTSFPLLVEAVRCWRRSRDIGRAVQPSLAALLARHGHEMLAPVLDSLIYFYEAALGRRLSVGDPQDISGDERLLLSLIEKPASRAARLNCPAQLARTFDLAIQSTLIMLRIPVSRA